MGEPMDRAAEAHQPMALDFVNTVDWRNTRQPTERLNGYADLVTWLCAADALTPSVGQRMLAAAGADGEGAQAAFARARALREAIYRVFAAVARGEAIATPDLAPVSVAASEALAHARLAPTAQGSVEWEWPEHDAPLERALWPVARSAAALLVSARLGRVRECEGDGCGWLFLDTSKNRSRRWCSMDSCGNRAKARRHYARVRATQAGA
ncbi:MAG TPA: ABATE domain-containing protein [Ktedonobacterales bacterium]